MVIRYQGLLIGVLVGAVVGMVPVVLAASPLFAQTSPGPVSK